MWSNYSQRLLQMAQQLQVWSPSVAMYTRCLIMYDNNWGDDIQLIKYFHNVNVHESQIPKVESQITVCVT